MDVLSLMTDDFTRGLQGKQFRKNISRQPPRTVKTAKTL